MSMTFTIKLKPSGVTFPGSGQRSLLDSAILSNYILQYGCKDGRCGVCKSKLIKGEVDQQACVAGISKSELKNGYVLTCCAKPRSDIEIEADCFPELQGIETKVVPCRVDTIEYPETDTAIIKLRLPPNSRFEYLAGQYVDFIYDGKRRSYSIANISSGSKVVEFHIRRVQGGHFSHLFFNEIKENQLYRFEGPYGTFFVRDKAGPIIFLAGGTGFAPVKAMIEKLIESNSSRQIYLYWGASTISGFYSRLPVEWQKDYSNIKYTPVYSGSSDKWNGRKGMVHLAVTDDFKTLKDFEVYACGSPDMIESAKNAYLENGLNQQNFHSDAFIKS